MGDKEWWFEGLPTCRQKLLIFIDASPNRDDERQIRHCTKMLLPTVSQLWEVAA